MDGEKNERPQPKITPSAEPRPSDSTIISQADALYEQGWMYYRRRELHRARELFSRVKTIQPDRRGIDALLDEIDILVRLESLEPQRQKEAVGEAKKETAPARPAPVRRARWPVFLVVGLLLIVAAVTAGFVIMRWPQQNDAERLWILAQAYYNSGGYDKATETLTKLLAVNPNPYDVEAKALLEMAKRLADIKRSYQKATAFRAQEQWEEAARELKTFNDLCQRLSSTIPDPELRRACQDVAGELPSIERKAQLTSLYMEGKALYDQQEWSRAAEAFQKLQATDPEYKKDEVIGYLYVTYLSHGERVIEVAGNATDQVELAIDLFQRASKIRPNDSRPADELSMAKSYLQALNAFHASNWELVRVQAESIYKQRSNYAGGRIAGLLCTSYLRLGDAAYDKGDRETALSFYRQVLNAQGCDRTEAEVKEHKVFVELNPLTPTPTQTITGTPTPLPTDTLPPFGTPPPTYTPRPTDTWTPRPTDTPVPPPPPRPTDTPVPPSNTPQPPTNTPRPTNTTPPTNTPQPPTNTPQPPTSTPVPPSPTWPSRGG